MTSTKPTSPERGLTVPLPDVRAEERRKRAAIYIRVSSTGQEDNSSLATQEDGCRAYVAQRGYTLDERHVYREVHTAVELDERPALSRARAAMQRGEFDVFIFYNPDRFSRKTVHSGIMMYYCERAGVALEFASFEHQDTAIGRYILQTYVFAAEMEHQKFKERSTAGKRARREAGKLPGTARPLYGYRYADSTRGKLEADPETAIVVREIFDRAKRGETLRGIAAALTGRFPTPTGKERWAYTTISGILGHPGYCGRPEDCDPPLPAGTVPALVDAATFAAVQEQLGRNQAAAARHQRHPELYLLRGGLARCGYCRKPLHAGWKTTRSAGRARYPVYFAQARWHAACAPGQHQFSAAAEALDRAVWADVFEYLDDPTRLFDRAAEREGADPVAGLVEATERAIAQCGKQQASLAKTLALLGEEEDEVRETLLRELRAAAGAARQQRAELARLAARRTAWELGRDRRRDMLALWETAGRELVDDYAGRRAALEALGVRVYVWAGPAYAIEAREFGRGRGPLAGAGPGGIVSGCSCGAGHNTTEAAPGAPRTCPHHCPDAGAPGENSPDDQPLTLRPRGPLR